MPAIEGLGLTKSFGAVDALKEASFAAEHGEVHALVGENGAGKSTLIKLLCGLFPPDAGDVRLAGDVVRFTGPRDAYARGIGTVFQELTLLPYMTVAENLLLGREPRSGPLIARRRLVARAHELFAEAGITGIEPLEIVANLSLGQRQIVEIVKTLARRPTVLFMDEPTSALAEQSVAWLFGIMTRLRDAGTCIVFTSHRWAEIKGIADRITIFRNGRDVGTYAAAELGEQAAVERMTGRQIDALFPAVVPSGSAVVVARAQNLCAPGIDDVTFAVREGEVLGIGGLAGQGQRELFLALFGVAPVRSGTLEVGGAAVRSHGPREAIRRGIALIPEDRKTEGLLLSLPVRQNLSLAILDRLAERGFVRRNEERRLVDETIASLAVRTPSSDQPVGMLSGGNQQKVLIGRWLLTRARLLLLYDITRGVDVATKRDIYELIARLSAEGRSILFYSTDTEEIAHLCGRVLVMREGRVVRELRDGVTPEAIVAAAIHVPERVGVEIPA